MFSDVDLNRANRQGCSNTGKDCARDCGTAAIIAYATAIAARNLAGFCAFPGRQRGVFSTAFSPKE
jgi:hypothetical protein